MKKLTVFRILLVLLLVFVTLATARPAYADTHYLITLNNDFTYTLSPNNPDLLSPCNFDIQVHEYGKQLFNLWVDENGNFLGGVFIYGNFRVDWTAYGKTVNFQVQGPAHANVVYYTDKIVETFQLTGTTDLVTIPGYGIIHGGGGLVLETLTFTPDGTFISLQVERTVGNINDDWGPLCTYLAS